MPKKKELIIIAGANGSGKTTFAKPYTQALGFQFLNADEIAKNLENEGLTQPLVKAGRIFFAKLSECIEKEANFVVETTLSGSYINKVASRAIEKGYELKVIYLFLDNPKVCIERVKTRVIKGGHDVPIEAITRRFYRSKVNFWNNFTEMANEWTLMYNGSEGFQQVAIGSKNEFSIDNQILFDLFLSNVEL